MNNQETPVRWCVETVVRSTVLLGILFGSAGTVRWPAAWIAVGMFLTFCLLLIGWLRKHDPALLRERAMAEKDAQRPGYDHVFSALYKLMFLVWLSILGLDAVRFGWSDPPIWVNALGAVFMVGAFRLLFSVFVHNSYLVREVRVQTERHHKVIRTGPYGIVRHPMYAATSCMFVGASMLLGSYLGICLALLMGLMLCIRSVLEESTLTASLDGYAEYKRTVRSRIVPGVWLLLIGLTCAPIQAVMATGTGQSELSRAEAAPQEPSKRSNNFGKSGAPAHRISGQVMGTGAGFTRTNTGGYTRRQSR